MLVIRLQRTGRSNLAAYRLVIAEKARPVKGKFHEIVGHYLPSQNDGVFQINAERIMHWIRQGAIPSDTVARLLKRQGMKDMDTFIKRYSMRKPKKTPPEVIAPPSPTPAPATETSSVPEAVIAPVESPIAPVAEEASATPAEDESKPDGDKA